MRGGRVAQRVVDVRDRRAEHQRVNFVRELLRGAPSIGEAHAGALARSQLRLKCAHCLCTCASTHSYFAASSKLLGACRRKTRLSASFENGEDERVRRETRACSVRLCSCLPSERSLAGAANPTTNRTVRPTHRARRAPHTRASEVGAAWACSTA